MHAHQWAFREKRIIGRDAADKGVGEILADLHANVAVVTLARHEHHHRHETIEAVVARQHAHARAFVELQNRQRKARQRLLVDLEQLVARILLQHVGQSLAGMTVGIETGARFDAGYLAAQIGNAVGGARIGRRREQTDDAEFADQLARRIEPLDTDIVEIDAAMHARMNIRLGDDQRARLLQKRHDFRRYFEQFAATSQHAEVARPHDAKRGVEIGLDLLALDIVVAQAEESEIVGQQPLQELDRLGDLVDRQRRRIVLQIGDDGIDAIEHRPPVLHREPHFAEYVVERSDQIAARRFIGRIEMNGDETLAGAGGFGRSHRGQLAAIALHAEHRMRHQPDIEPMFGDFAHHRVDEERHIVVDELDDRHGLALAGVAQRHGLAANLGCARLPLAQKIVSPLGQHRDVVGAVAHHIFRHGAGKDMSDEGRRDVAAPADQNGGGIVDQSGGGRIVVTDGTLEDGKNLALQRIGRAGRECSHSPGGRREQHILW